MNNNNFTAQEIKSLQKTTTDVFKEIVEAIKAVKDACSSMSGVVASGDSDLSSKWSSISDSIAGPITTADNSFNYIGDILNSFVEKTISNEESAESDLGSIDSEISALGSQASNLVDLMNAAGEEGVSRQTPSPNMPDVIYAPPKPGPYTPNNEGSGEPLPMKPDVVRPQGGNSGTQNRPTGRERNVTGNGTGIEIGDTVGNGRSSMGTTSVGGGGYSSDGHIPHGEGGGIGYTGTTGGGYSSDGHIPHGEGGGIGYTGATGGGYSSDGHIPHGEGGGIGYTGATGGGYSSDGHIPHGEGRGTGYVGATGGGYSSDGHIPH